MHLKTKSFKKDELIVKKGDYSENIYIIKNGEVALSKKDDNVYAYLKSGDIFGTVDFILEKASRYSAMALTEVEIEVVDPRIFGQFYDCDESNFIKPILQSMAEEIRIYEQKIEDDDNSIYQSDYTSNNVVKVILRPETKKAKQLLNNLEFVEINKFPFKVGRFTRRRGDMLFHKNDLNLLDIPPYSISRSHFSITKKNGNYFFTDRGSRLGTIVNGKKVGDSQHRSKIILDRAKNQILFGRRSDKLEFSIEILKNP
jgi:CRP/FNR family transcriptional regulator, cyclic AMP receptor protein